MTQRRILIDGTMAKNGGGFTYLANDGNTTLCLGTYAFKWGHKQEATPTWFGMFLPDGRRTPAIDTMTELWSGHRQCRRARRNRTDTRYVDIRHASGDL